MTFPSPQEAADLLRRLLDGDPVAAPLICEAYLAPLLCSLRRKRPHADPHLVEQAVHDALLDFLARPDKYRPDKSALASFLRLAADGDLKNLLAGERRKKNRREDVELDSLARKDSRSDQPLLRLALQEETADMLDTVRQVAEESSPSQRVVLGLILDGVRATEPFAQALGVGDLPPEQQRRAVYREKDKINKRLKRRHLP